MNTTRIDLCGSSAQYLFDPSKGMWRLTDGYAAWNPVTVDIRSEDRVQIVTTFHNRSDSVRVFRVTVQPEHPQSDTWASYVQYGTQCDVRVSSIYRGHFTLTDRYSETGLLTVSDLLDKQMADFYRLSIRIRDYLEGAGRDKDQYQTHLRNGMEIYGQLMQVAWDMTPEIIRVFDVSREERQAADVAS